ncbi:MAG: TIGR00159 family protein [Elusimicrobia bacterium]|nr:TIGR00159 family protein [Elusimicrobiota bacterium]
MLEIPFIIKDVASGTVDIIIVTFLFYKLFMLIRDTRAVQVLKGLIILSMVTIFAQILQLPVLRWIMGGFWTIGVITAIIVFQPELRNALAQIGANRFANIFLRPEFVTEIGKAIEVCAARKMGAIIALERATGLRNYIESGAKINSEVTAELLGTIFTPNSPLHDGAVIIRPDRIAAAACILPLSRNPNLPKSVGTRHRAALGLTEETDAAVIVVSEETGDISLVHDKKILSNLAIDTLEKEITNLYTSASSQRFHWQLRPSFNRRDMISNLDVKLISFLLAWLLWVYVKYYLGH